MTVPQYESNTENGAAEFTLTLSTDEPIGMDDRVKIDADPEDALRAMLKTRRRPQRDGQ